MANARAPIKSLIPSLARLALVVALASACSDADSASVQGVCGVGGAAGNGNGGSVMGGGAGSGSAGTSAGGSPLGGSAGSGGTGSGSGGSASGGSGGSGSCLPGTPAILFVVDTSGSMDTEVQGTSSSRWEALGEVLEPEVFDMLPDTAGVGLFTFPNRPTGDEPCLESLLTLPFSPMNQDHRAALSDALAAADLDGPTPTHDAYRVALQALDAAVQSGPKAIVLITDGSPNYSLGCIGENPPVPVDPAPLIDEIGDAAARGIRTFVVGWLGTETEDRSWLSTAAVMGGTASAGCADPSCCHIEGTVSPSFGAQLLATMQAAFCDF